MNRFLQSVISILAPGERIIRYRTQTQAARQPSSEAAPCLKARRERMKQKAAEAASKMRYATIRATKAVSPEGVTPISC